MSAQLAAALLVAVMSTGAMLPATTSADQPAPTTTPPPTAWIVPEDHGKTAWATPGATARVAAATATPAPEPSATAMPAARLAGRASWYGTGMVAAAGPALRAWLGRGWRGTTLRVCAPQRGCVVVQASDWCLCHVGGSERVIDLGRDAFAQLADPARGLVRVTVEVVP